MLSVELGARLEDRHQHRAKPVDANHVGLRRCSVVDVSDIAHVDNRAVDLLDRHIVDGLDGSRAGIQPDVPVEAADLRGAGRDDQVLLRQRVRYIFGENSIRLHRLQIKVRLHRAIEPTIGNRHRSPGHAGELRPQEVVAKVEQARLRNSLARQRHLDDRNGCGIIGQHPRRCRAGRQQLQHRLPRGGHLRDRRTDIDRRLERDLDDAIPEDELGLDCLDVVHLHGEQTLKEKADAVGHFVRQQAVVRPYDSNLGNVDVWKHINRRGRRGAHAAQQNKNHHDNDSDRLPQGDLHE